MDEPDSDAMLPAAIIWHAWDARAFRLAGEQDRPVLLYIGCAWSQLSSVMDETTFADARIAALVQTEFVPVRVDGDRRPDVAARYGAGEWPATLVLSPDGEVLYGGGYVPPLAMSLLLAEVVETFRASRAAIQARQAEAARPAVEDAYDGLPAAPLASPAAARAWADGVATALLEQLDPIFPGFGVQPKRPLPDALALLLRRGGAAADAADRVLEAMRRGPIHDQEEGGFFRLAGRRDWSSPQFEKLLDLNAGLLAVYVWAFQRGGKAAHLEAALSIVRYVNDQLWDAGRGMFRASQRADDDYYRCRLAQRQQLGAPPVDHTAIAGWNARMAAAYLRAAPALDLPSLGQQAERVLDQLWHDCYKQDLGLRHALPLVLSLDAWLDDQVQMLAALADAHAYTGEARFLRRAEELAGVTVARFWDEPGGGCRDLPGAADAWGLLAEPRVPPAENARLAESLFYLARATGRADYRAQGEAALRGALPGAEQPPEAVAAFAGAVYAWLDEPVRCDVIGPPDDPATIALLRACLNLFAPGKLVRRVEPDAEGQPVVYLRLGAATSPPIADPKEVGPALKKLKAG